MDNLTHTLVGVLLARAGLNKLTPRGTLLAAIAANAPDFDAISLVGGVSTYFAYHRWMTHAIVAIPLVAVLPVLIVAAIGRQKLPWIRAWLVSMTAICSHLLLDLTNPYGIRLFLPWSESWPALDITNVVDLWIWAILLIGVLWPVLSGLVSSEIGAKRSVGRGLAIAALILVAIYDGARYFLHSRAVETLQSRIYQGAAARRVLALPHAAIPTKWRGLVETEKSWQTYEIDLAREFDVAPSGTFQKPDSNQSAIEAAARLPEFQHLAGFSRAPHWTVVPSGEPGGNVRVQLTDLYFGFTAIAVVIPDGRVQEPTFHF